MKTLKSRDITITIGNFNANVGKGSEGDFIGNFGLGSHNEGETH